MCSIFVVTEFLGLDISSYFSKSFSISSVSRFSRSLEESDKKTFLAKFSLTFRHCSLDSFKGGLISEFWLKSKKKFVKEGHNSVSRHSPH